MVQKDVVGCGGGIEMKCPGGCLTIHKTLYACKMRAESSAEQLEKVSALCGGKEECAVNATRKMFGYKECPGTPDSDMNLWITYSCDGGKDHTRITGPTRCINEGDSLFKRYVDNIVSSKPFSTEFELMTCKVFFCLTVCLFV